MASATTMEHSATGRWAVPTFPFDPQEPPGLTEVPDATVARMRRGDLRTLSQPDRWLQGAVYDGDRRLVVASQKLAGLPGARMVIADPPHLPLQSGLRVLGGTWLYGGHWIQHFGHFFTESLTTLWPEGLDVDGVVFHAYMRKHSGVRRWQRKLLDLTPYGDVPLEIVDTEPLGVERLLVPGRSLVLDGWAHPEALRVWRRMAAAAGARSTLDPSGDRVFLSRSAFNREFRETGKEKRVRTEAERDLALDRCFEEAGFRVVAPEQLTIPDQIRLAAGASVLAGATGSALHLSAFAPPGLRVLELGDRRSPTESVPMQRIIDHLGEHPSAFVPHGVPVDRLADELRALGLH